MKGTPSEKGVPFKWSKQKSVCGISVVKREIAAVFTAAISIFGGPEEDRTPEPFGCEQAPKTFFEYFRPFLAVSAPLHFIFGPL